MAEETNVIPFPKRQPDEPVTTTDNVIPFPIQPKTRIPDPKDEAEIKERVAKLHYMHCEESIAALTPYIMDRILNLGFMINSQEYLKDIALIIEASRSIMYKYHGFAHPLQKVAEDIFEQKDGLVTWNSSEEPSGIETPVIVSEDDIMILDEEDGV